MMPSRETAPELHAARLLRAAQGDRSLEAAVVLLAEAELLGRLDRCIVVDADRRLAWLDWDSAFAVADGLPPAERAAVVMASAIATEGSTLLSAQDGPLRLALHHLLT